MNKLTKILLPISSVAISLAPTISLTSCGKSYIFVINDQDQDIPCSYVPKVFRDKQSKETIFQVTINSQQQFQPISFDSANKPRYSIDKSMSSWMELDDIYYNYSQSYGQAIQIQFNITSLERDGIQAKAFEVFITKDY